MFVKLPTNVCKFGYQDTVVKESFEMYLVLCEEAVWPIEGWEM